MKIPIYVIGDSTSPRNPDLSANLGKDFTVRFVPPIRFSGVREAITENQLRKFEAIYFREPLVGEIGCAIAHQRVQNLIAKNQVGGIVLEDDAFILDYPNLKSLYLTFLRESNFKPSLLNFTANQPIENCVSVVPIGVSIPKKVFGPTPLACGYMLNASAAEILSKANFPFRFKADWPPVSIRHYRSSIPLAAHGSHLIESTIEKDKLRRGLTRVEKVSVVIFLRYITRLKEIESILEYCSIMIKPRIFNLLNKLLT